MVAAPRTLYTRSGDVDIAYQDLGEGPYTVLLLPGMSVPIDCIDGDPALERFHRRIASFARLLRFDQRGIGMSSHLPAGAEIGPAYWAEDALAVLDAAGVDSATVVAPAFSAMTGVLLAARTPQRVSRLVLVNGTARALVAPDYPIGVDPSVAAPYLDVAVDPDAVALGFDGLSVLAPSVAGDPAFRAWWDRSGNRAATPSMALAVTRALLAADVRAELPSISAPTLVLHRPENLFIGIEFGRYLAEGIPGARLVELPGRDALHWIGDDGELLDEIEEFVTGHRSGAVDRVLTTILFTDIVGSTDLATRLGDTRWRDLLERHDLMVRREFERFGGREVNTVGDGFVATFASPSLALDCARAVTAAVRPLGVEVRAGLHAGEVEVRGDDIAGVAVHIGARVCALAEANEVLATSTVRDIVAGSQRTFVERGWHDLRGVPGPWRLVALVDRATDEPG